MSFNSLLAKANSSTVVALNGKAAGSFTNGPILSMGGVNNVEWDSLCANVSAGITTSTITIATRWAVSQDGITYNPIFPQNGAASVGVPAAGSGSLVTSTYVQALPVNVPYPYVTLQTAVGVVPGGAGDNIAISYNWKKRAAGGA